MKVLKFTAGEAGAALAVCVPEAVSETGRYKVIWALHGMARTYDDWLDENSVLPNLLEGEKVILVCPNAESGFYVDGPSGERWETALMGNAWDFVKRHFPISENREDHAVIGFSMGGYGAMFYGLKYPERFGYIASFAGGVNVPQRYAGGENIMNRLQYFFGPADAVIGSDCDLYRKARALADSGMTLPEIYMCVGRRDPHENGPNQEYRDYLRSLGFSVTWNEGDFDHNMEFVNHFMPEWIEIFLKK